VQPLRVDDRGHLLVHADGSPFFYLADTAWELFHLLTVEEIDVYFKNRREKGFTVIQSVILSEYDGLRTPNAYGYLPLEDEDPLHPNEKYFDFVVQVLTLAEENGLYIGLLPTWGDKVDKWHWGIGPEIFTRENAVDYGAYLGKKLGKHTNIIWILGGDRFPFPHIDLWRALAHGIRKTEPQPHLMTYHPIGERSSSTWLHQEPWLTFNMLQSGHADRCFDNYSMVLHDYHLSPPKPCLDGEPRYENHIINSDPLNGRFDGADVRSAAYWAVFAGACGHTYGCNEIWQFYDTSRKPYGAALCTWQEAMDMEGAWSMLHLRNLIESRPGETRVPDQMLISACQGSHEHHVQAMRDAASTYAMLYLPAGRPVVPDLTRIEGKVLRTWWYNPRNGQSTLIGTCSDKSPVSYKPLMEGHGQDWVLVIDSAERNYPPPGKWEDYVK